MVEINGIQSNTKKQERGIRQGCPLSPYLFVLVMTALLHDVHWQAEKRKDYPEGIYFGAVFYADDTILIGKKQKKYKKCYKKLKKYQRSMG